jgi:hypothetical protein
MTPDIRAHAGRQRAASTEAGAISLNTQLAVRPAGAGGRGGQRPAYTHRVSIIPSTPAPTATKPLAKTSRCPVADATTISAAASSAMARDTSSIILRIRICPSARCYAKKGAAIGEAHQLGKLSMRRGTIGGCPPNLSDWPRSVKAVSQPPAILNATESQAIQGGGGL